MQSINVSILYLLISTVSSEQRTDAKSKRKSIEVLVVGAAVTAAPAAASVDVGRHCWYAEMIYLFS